MDKISNTFEASRTFSHSPDSSLQTLQGSQNSEAASGSGLVRQIPGTSQPHNSRSLANMSIHQTEAGPSVELPVEPYQNTIPDNEMVNECFEQVKQLYEQLDSINTIKDIPGQPLSDCLASLKELIGQLSDQYSMIIEVLKTLEWQYPLEAHQEKDFSDKTAMDFHELFSKCIDAELIKIELNLRIESQKQANYRSYESAFSSLGYFINSRINELSPRLCSYLTDYSIQNRNRQSTLITQFKKLKRYVDRHSIQKDYNLNIDPELKRAVLLINRYRPDNEYTLSQYNRFQKMAERIILDLSRPQVFAISEAMIENPRHTLDNIQRIINHQDQTSDIFARTPKTNDKLARMMVMSFLNLRGLPHQSASQAPNLLKYIRGENQSPDTLKAGLAELKKTAYWVPNCREEFKAKINKALINPSALNAFKQHLDNCIIQENLGFTNLNDQNQFEVFNLISSFKGTYIAYGNPYRQVIERLCQIPGRCQAMLDHIFGTSKELIKDYPENHYHFQHGHLFSCLQAMNAEEGGINDIRMEFGSNRRVNLIIQLQNGKEEIFPTAIINPDGNPHTPSPMNPIQIVFGPLKSIPLAIEAGSKAVTYNAMTGYHNSTYSSRAKLTRLHNNGACMKLRESLEKKAICNLLDNNPRLALLYRMNQEQKSKELAIPALKPLAIKHAPESTR